MPQPLDYGEYTPQRFIEGGSKPWPISHPSQVNEVRAFLRDTLKNIDADPVTGLEVLVKWHRLPPTRARLFRKDFGDGVSRECFEERDKDSGERIIRSWSEIQHHVHDLQAANGIKPYDIPPRAEGAEPE